MITSLLPIIGSLLTGILIPIFGIWLKGYFQKQADAKAATEREAQEQKTADTNDTNQAAKTATENGSIDAQTEARKNPFP